MDSYAIPMSWSLPVRLASLGVLLAVEGVALATIVHTHSLGLPLLQFLCAGGSLAIIVAWIRARPLIYRISGELSQRPIEWSFAGWHVAALAALLGAAALPESAGFVRTAVVFCAAAVSILLAAIAVVPLASLIELARGIGSGWLWALGGALLARPIAYLASAVWAGSFSAPIIAVTFYLTKALLSVFGTSIVADPAQALIGTRNFTVLISGGCSGLEGVGLMLLFTGVWLWVSRRELRFPRALWLIPLGALAMGLLNVVRIAGLILIGAAGAPEVAVGGFHSQAGWIAFNGAALTLALLSRKLSWFSKERAPDVPQPAVHNAAAAYMLPFLATLAAGLISRAASGGFEWLYPLRLVACAAALWIFRGTLSRLDWRFGWISIAVGCAVFPMWLAFDRMAGGHPDKGIVSGLAALPHSARLLWLVLRTMTAVLAAPVGEELAFRGFLIRRVMRADFESLGTRSFTWVSLLVSSAAFGVLHGERWMAGIVAGLLYGAVYLRRGRIGDAVVAHASTNALLSAYVLWAGRWDLW